MNIHHFSFSPTNLPDNAILGGSVPLLEILSSTYYFKPTLKSLRSRSIMFLSQLTSAYGDRLLPWTDLNDPDRP